MLKFNSQKVFYFFTLGTLIFTVFLSGTIIGKGQVVPNVCKPENLEFSLFWDAYNKLKENFINPEKIDDQKVLYGAISGMAKSLGDPYTDFFDPEEAKLFEQDLSGSFSGIGIEIAVKKDQLIIVSPIKDTPSDKAGLKSGDQIIKVDGKSTLGMSEDQAVNMIRGKKGASITLTILREGWSQAKDFKITRDTITIPPMKLEFRDGGIAYIHIFHFNQTLSDEFKKAAFQILASPSKKIVLDLRNNPGGYLEVSQEIAGWFLQDGQVVTIEDFGRGKVRQEYKAQGNSSFAKYPIVVLMNKGSASASEILAGALRDQRNIQLVGETSFGKGSVQKLVELKDGLSFLKITVAKWLTPKGNSISEVGLSPDVKVEANAEDIKAGKDLQLEKALEIIKGLK